MGYTYLPMFEHEARRHEERAAHWRSLGMEDYAKGSDIKAKRWRARQDSLRRLYPENPVLDAHLYEIERAMSQALDKALFGTETPKSPRHPEG